MQSDDYYDFENTEPEDESEGIGDFFEQESEDDADLDQQEEIIIRQSDKEEIARIAKSLSAGGQLTQKDYEIFKLFASDSIKSILFKRGQKINATELEEMIHESITSFWQHIDKNRGVVIENAPGYFYKVCQSIIYKIKVKQPNSVYFNFRSNFIKTLKKLEIEKKILSYKEKRAATSEKLRIPDRSDDISPRSAAAEFEANLLIQEERWTAGRKLELEALMLHILNRITGSITVSQLEKCVADRIYIKQDFKITISPTDSRPAEEDEKIQNTPEDPDQSPEEYFDPDIDIYFQKFREDLEAKIYELAGSKKIARKVLKAWHYYTFQDKTLEEVAEKFGYAGASGAEEGVKNQTNQTLMKYIQNKLDKMAPESKHRELMQEIIMNDLDRIIPGL
ncbi:MAG: hypothetical protein FMNOHCHN_00540 [Ignavibacteriaceae bacterium]|nr:hypothetical protein [Ignavibacteriaceae bacterium]